MDFKVYGVMAAAASGLQAVHECLKGAAQVQAAVEEAEGRYEELKTRLSPDAKTALDKSKEQALAEGTGLPRALVLLNFFLRHSAQMIGAPAILVGAASAAEVCERVYSDGRKVLSVRHMNLHGGWSWRPKSTEVGNFVHIDPGVELGESGKIDHFAELHAINPLQIGDNFHIGYKAEMYGGKYGINLKVGKYVRAGAWIIAGDNVDWRDYVRPGDRHVSGSDIVVGEGTRIDDGIEIKSHNRVPAGLRIDKTIEENQYPPNPA